METLVKPLKKNNKSRLGEIVIKHYGEKTVISKYPDMSSVVPSEFQLKKRTRFADAVAYAKTISSNYIFRADFLKRRPEAKSVYQEALKEYLGREV